MSPSDQILAQTLDLMLCAVCHQMGRRQLNLSIPWNPGNTRALVKRSRQLYTDGTYCTMIRVEIVLCLQGHLPPYNPFSQSNQIFISSQFLNKHCFVELWWKGVALKRKVLSWLSWSFSSNTSRVFNKRHPLVVVMHGEIKGCSFTKFSFHHLQRMDDFYRGMNWSGQPIPPNIVPSNS